MKTFQNLTLIGTSHIAQESVNEVVRTIDELGPEVVALELDQTRFYALMHKKKRKIKLSDLPKIGFKGYLFAALGGYLQKKLGKIVNVEPGAEMLAAVKVAKAHKLQIALVDQPIEITLERFSQELSWKERFRFIADIFKGVFFGKRELKKLGLDKMDLTKVPQEALVKKLITDLKKRYPNIYKVLVKERNEVLARNLHNLLEQQPDAKVVAVVGAGHETEIIKLLHKYSGSS